MINCEPPFFFFFMKKCAIKTPFRSFRSHHLCRNGVCVVLMVMFVVAVLYNSRQVSSHGSPLFSIRTQSPGVSGSCSVTHLRFHRLMELISYVSYVLWAQNVFFERGGPLKQTCKVTGRTFCLSHFKWANQISWQQCEGVASNTHCSIHAAAATV